MGKTREEIKNMKKGTDRCARPAGAYPARALYCVQYGQSQSAQPVTLQRPTVTRTITTPVVAESVEQPITKADFEEALRKTQSSVLARSPLRAAWYPFWQDRCGSGW